MTGKFPPDGALVPLTRPVSREGSVVGGDGYRITVLTSRLFRIETSPSGEFTDEATQIVWFRDLETPSFTVERAGRTVSVRTEDVSLFYDVPSGRASVSFGDGRRIPCTNRGNLKGTMRTLDGNFGIYFLKNGIMSRTGVSVLTDDTLALDGNGLPARRKPGTDRYVFAYGRDFRGALRDFYRIAGGVPLIPRFALGNWWSRYRAYTQSEYEGLMKTFADRDVPISVAVVDMDWHWVNVNERFGRDYGPRAGWTGFSWNTDLFPDHVSFLRNLRDRGLKVALNLHPADGVRSFEDMYPETAKAAGVDPSSGTDVPFDVSPAFMKAFLDTVLRPYEREGVDFWWIDWQQGRKSSVKGLDPLWALNHCLTLDNAREHRPLILSRYAGMGSHRYPLGFSGDTIMRWSSLRRQPYFTANAANAGYTWWSHDIGGHMLGVRDDELYLRWLQYGVFSPVCRLHSTSSDLAGKEPWAYRPDVCRLAEEALRLRHRLIPYTYAMNRRTHSEGLPICEPMYYGYPEEREAYRVPNQYMFGSELLVCPIVKKTDRRTGTASAKAWIPPGRWTDVFTGTVYTGSRVLKLFRGLTSVPVLIREGGIVPLSADGGNSVRNPVNLELLISRGKGEFVLYEDGGEDLSYEEVHAETRFSVSEGDGKTVFTICPSSGDLSVLPARRNYVLRFADLSGGTAEVSVNGGEPVRTDCPHVTSARIRDVSPADRVRVTFSGYSVSCNPPASEAVSRAVADWQGNFIKKAVLYRGVRKRAGRGGYREAVRNSFLPKIVKEEIYELLDKNGR